MIPKLQILYMYLTEGCNLACRHCWMSPRLDTSGRGFPSLPVETFETAIREARPLGLETVKLTGGEPLLHPEIRRLLEIIRREGLGLQIETNGILCSREMAFEIARHKKCFVSVSLDGIDARTHENVRGVAGSFAAAKQAVCELAEAGVRPQVICTVFRSNIDQVDRMIPFVESLGAASLKFNIVQPTARGERVHEDPDTPGISELIALGRRVETELAARTRMTLLFDHPPAFRSLRRISSGNSASCGIRGILGVLAGGTYALCGIGEQLPEMVFGTIGKDPLEKIWTRHPLLTELREGLPARLEGICGQCLMKQGCLGSCIAQNFYRSGSLWAPFWFCRQAAEAGLFPASRRWA